MEVVLSVEAQVTKAAAFEEGGKTLAQEPTCQHFKIVARFTERCLRSKGKGMPGERYAWT